MEAAPSGGAEAADGAIPGRDIGAGGVPSPGTRRAGGGDRPADPGRKSMGATAAASVQFWSVSCSPVLGDYPLITARARSSRWPPWIGAPINNRADQGPVLVAS